MLLSTIDWVIIALYFIITLLVGLFYAGRAGKNISEYFISGRNMPWWLLGTSMVATTFAADTPNLVTEIVRRNGVSGNWVWWAFLLTGMVTVFFYAKLWRRSEALTDIGFYEMRYSGKKAAFLRGFRAIYLGVFFNVVIMATVTLAAIKIGNIVLGLDKYTTVIICALITAIYSCTSGIWGVVVTDLLQFTLAITASIGAAYFALQHPEVDGLRNLLTHEAIQGKLHFLPDFSSHDVIYIFIIPIAVQWWATWYPGAEPGGGGYVAQRMLAAKDEKNSLLATLWFNFMHYAIRPWPWILVALASLVVFPDLESIGRQFPQIEQHGIDLKHDLGYPAMLVFMPAGMLGLIIASLAAAYMSTISTHLNWGASYVVDDFYKRFIRQDASDRHYVFVARLVTVILMILAGFVSFYLETALDSFHILLQIGAGTGLIFLLRWFWWRINAWSEIVAMIVSFLIAIYFEFIHERIGYTALESWQQLVIGVVITTVAWLLATFLTRPTDPEVLSRFYQKIRPLGPGWRQFASANDSAEGENFTASLLCVVLGCFGIYSSLFATGYLLYGRTGLSILFAIIAVICATGIIKLFPKLGWRMHNQ